MKYRLTFVQSVALFAMVFFLACDSDPSSSGGIFCDNPSLHIKKVTFQLQGTLYDFQDTTPGSGFSLSMLSRVGDSVTASFAGSSDSADLYLALVWQGYRTGDYGWQNVGADSVGYGCFVAIGSQKYRPVSGTTHVQLFTHPPVEQMDSLFGTFCGSLRDQNGNIVEISNGRFYFD